MTFPTNKEDCTKKAIELLNNFIDDKLAGSIENLKTYSLWGIDGDKVYGNYETYPDADRTKIMYAIDYLLYADVIPDFEKNGFRLYGYTTETSLYSGETLNTFNTLFSSNIDIRKKIAEIYGNDFEKDVFDFNDTKNFHSELFYYVYQRIGNLTFLPCLTICGGSINTWKGCSSINDYLYPFLKLLEETYKQYKLNEEPNRTDIHWELWLLMKKNSFFFDKIDSFQKYIDFFDLQGWEKLNLGENNFLHNSELNDNNIAIAKNYVKEAKTFINSRTERMVNKLKFILNQ